MAIVVGGLRVEVGDRVSLRACDASSGLGMGSLNSTFLFEEGATTSELYPVTAVQGNFATIKLPSGYALGIKARDISELAKP